MGINLQEIEDRSVPEVVEDRVAITFSHSMLNTYMQEWMYRKQQLRSGEITRDEYTEWKLNWPYTSDSYFFDLPHKQWRKDE